MLSRIRATLFGATLAALTALSSLSPTSAAAQASRPAPRAAVTTKTTEQIAALGRRATVTILALDAAGDTISQGSGVLIREDGVVVTNWHVMAGASRAKVRLSNGEVVDRVLFLEGDSTADLAILRLATLGVPTAPTTTTVPDPGARVTVIGAPQGLSLSVSDGVVSATRLVNGKTLVQLTAAISPGSSGGPVFDSQGRVFAIATSSLESGQALNFAMPIRYALALLPLATTPRSLESVFATGTPNGASSSGGGITPAPARTFPGGFAWPKPTESPVPSLAGAYRTRIRYASGPTAPPRENALIVLNDNGGGLMLVERDEGSAFDIFNALTTRSGRVSFKLISDSLATGYQTDDGFFTLFPFRGDTLFFEAIRSDLSLNRPDGLYDATSRTAFKHDEGPTGGNNYTDWKGTATVVSTRDSIWVVLDMQNTVGGNTAAYAASPLGPGGTLTWQSRRGDRLSGSISGGALNLEWVDRRDVGVFVGRIRGQRR